jgi:hypothetical protein
MWGLERQAIAEIRKTHLLLAQWEVVRASSVTRGGARAAFLVQAEYLTQNFNHTIWLFLREHLPNTVVGIFLAIRPNRPYVFGPGLAIERRLAAKSVFHIEEL